MPAPIGEYLLPIICRLPFIWLHRRCQPHHHWCRAMRKFLGLFYRESVGERLVGWATYVTVSRGPQGAGQAFWPFFVPFPGNSSVKIGRWHQQILCMVGQPAESRFSGATSYPWDQLSYPIDLITRVKCHWPAKRFLLSLAFSHLLPSLPIERGFLPVPLLAPSVSTSWYNGTKAFSLLDYVVPSKKTCNAMCLELRTRRTHWPLCIISFVRSSLRWIANC